LNAAKQFNEGGTAPNEANRRKEYLSTQNFIEIYAPNHLAAHPALRRRHAGKTPSDPSKRHGLVRFSPASVHCWQTSYGVPSRDDFLDGLKDERKVILNQILSRPKQKMIYEYDFGDGWEHELLLERVLAPEPGVRYPRCTDGARACPPEDCGGTGGYENFLAAIRDPNHEEHEEYLEWIGDEFDPEQFDVADVNAALRRVR
jgi:pRiA4b ORF-3-like protein